jgi:hypothetical protein
MFCVGLVCILNSCKPTVKNYQGIMQIWAPYVWWLHSDCWYFRSDNEIIAVFLMSLYFRDTCWEYLWMKVYDVWKLCCNKLSRFFYERILTNIDNNYLWLPGVMHYSFIWNLLKQNFLKVCITGPTADLLNHSRTGHTMCFDHKVSSWFCSVPNERTAFCEHHLPSIVSPVH